MVSGHDCDAERGGVKGERRLISSVGLVAGTKGQGNNLNMQHSLSRYGAESSHHKLIVARNEFKGASRSAVMEVKKTSR